MGVRVDTQLASPNPSAAPTENTSLFSDEVEVKDFTSTGEAKNITPSSVYQSIRSPGASIFSDVTYDCDRSADSSRLGSGVSTHSLTQFRLKQKRKRRRRRRRIAAASTLLFVFAAAVFWYKGQEIVPIANEVSGGRLARAVLPHISEETAIKYGLSTPSTTKKTRSTTIESAESDTTALINKKDKKDTIVAKTSATAMNGESEARKQRRAICNVPLMYLFFRPCWRESRSMPLDMSFLDSAME